MKIFGTDGLRGPVNQGPITPAMLARIAGAAARCAGGAGTALIGRDTRRSGRMIEAALAAGFMAAGVSVRVVGVAPTPAVSLLTRARGAALGVSATASHNPASDNGVKLFAADGHKVDDAFQDAVEAALDEADVFVAADGVADIARDFDAMGLYRDHVLAGREATRPLAGLRLVVDCANGAAFQIAPDALEALGADLVVVGADPDGMNINAECGSNHPELLIEAVRETGADAGLAFDGDADRVVLCDEAGGLIDGDQILAVLAAGMAAAGTLRGGAVAATVMSNIALERFLEARGAALVRTAVGDRHVAAQMRADGLNLGGEASGHVIVGDRTATGDGMMAGILMLEALQKDGRPASEALRAFTPAPQVQINVEIGAGDPMAARPVKDAIAAAEAALGDTGRVVVRKSGTEPLVRVMVEAMEEAAAKSQAEAIAEAVRGTG